MKKIELLSQREIERRLLSCVEQREVPQSLFLLGRNGAEVPARREKDSEAAVRLADFVRRSMPAVVRHVAPGTTLICGGVSGGPAERALLGGLAGGGLARCVAAGPNGDLVERALNAAGDCDADAVGVVSLMESLADLQPHWTPPVLFCLLDNTFCGYDPDFLLESVWSLMGPNDHFLFDCRFAPRPVTDGSGWRGGLDRARGPAQHLDFDLGPLADRGLKAENCRWNVESEPVWTAVGQLCRERHRIDVLREARLCFGRRTLALAAGDVIRTGFTYTYTNAQLGGFLWRYQLRIVENFVDTEALRRLVLVRKLRCAGGELRLDRVSPRRRGKAE